MKSLKDEVKAFNQILAPGDIAHIALQMLGCINKEVTNHTIRSAFITLNIAEAYPLSHINYVQRLMLLSLLHTIGFFREDLVFNYNPHDSNIDYFSDEKAVESKYIFSSFYLEYMTPLREDARALTNFTKPYDAELSKHRYQEEFRSIIYFSDRISDFVAKNPDKDLPEDVNQLAPGYFNPKVVEVFNKINAQNDLVEKIRSDNFRAQLSQYMFSVQCSEEDTKQLEKLLIYFLDFKSTYTMKHAVNTACYAISLGSRFNLDSKALAKLYTSAALHDIGKIATPQRILEFPGRLSPEDMGIMRHHVNHSRRILSGFVPFDILENVYRHHEKLNGKGYPKHITAEELTTVQRILTVADITSALNDSRSYKQEFSKDKVISIMADMTAQGELDPDISKFIIEDYDQIMLELNELQEVLKVDFSKVLTNYNAYILNENETELEAVEELDEAEELDDLEEL